MKAISLSLATFFFAHCSGSLAAEGVPGSGTWTEAWPDESGQLQTVTVTAEVWTETFQTDLDADGQLHIPARERPYYLDGPLVMKSGQTLTADTKAEIRLKPGSNTGMMRKEQVASTETAKLDELRRELEAWRKDVGAEMMKPNPDYDPAVKPTKKKKRKEAE